VAKLAAPSDLVGADPELEALLAAADDGSAF
jgi:hypothetical protein